MHLFVIGAGCSKAYSDSLSGQRMPIANDFFKVFNQLPNLNNNRWVLIGDIINRLIELKKVSIDDPFKEEFDIEEIHSLFEQKMYEAIESDDDLNADTYNRAYNQLVFLFAAVVNEISNGPISKAHLNLVQQIKNDDVILTYNWDTLLDRALDHETGWNVDSGYFIKPHSKYNDGWINCKTDKNYSGPLLLKMHGSANWITGYLSYNLHEKTFTNQLGITTDNLFVYVHSSKSYPCYDGRWEKVYEPFCYGYYPPNLFVPGRKIQEGYFGALIKPRTPFTAPKGNGPDSGVISMPLIIPPVKNKKYDYYGSLFTEIWNKGKESIIEADVITLIGYSFPITDIKSVNLFKEAFLERQTIPVFNIVDPKPERVVQLLKFELGVPDTHIKIFKEYFDENFDFAKLKSN